MELTRIEKENAEYFLHLCPEYLMDNGDLMRFGIIDDEGYASCACAVGVSENMLALKWLFTDPALREQGSATYLLEHIEELARELELEGVQTQFEESAEDLDDFLAGRDYLVGEDTQIYSVPIDDIAYGRVMEGLLSNRNTSSRAYRLPEDKDEKHQVITALADIYDIDPVILSDISSQYSVISMDENNKPEGAISVTEYGDKDLFITYLLSDGSVNGICDLICAFYDILIENDRIAKLGTISEEVDRVLANMGMSRMDLANDLAEGKQVKITDGPFKNMVGKISSYDLEKKKVELLLDLFGQETSVEVELSQIENIK